MSTEPPVPPRVSRRAVLGEAAILAAFVVLAAYKSGLTGGLAGSVFAGPDPLKDVWVLDRVARQLASPARVFEGNNFFPSHDAILFNDPLLGPALFAAPVRALGGGPVLAYNLAVLATLAMGSAAFYALARELGADRGGALVAAVSIPYMPPQMQHLSHLNLLALGGFALLVIALLRLLRAPGLPVACAAGAAFAWQAGTSGYWAFACAFLALVVVAWGGKALRAPATIAGLAGSACVAAGFLLPYLRGFLALRASEGALARDTVERADLSLDLVTGLWGTGAWWGRGWMPGPGDAATLAFPGLAVAALAAVGLWRGPRRAVALLAAIAVVFFALALGPRLRVMGHDLGPAPLAALEAWLPLFSAVRHPASFVALTLAALGLLAALGATALPACRRRGLLQAVLVAAALIEADTPPHRRVPAPSAPPPLYARLAALPRAGVLELPISPEADGLWQWWSVRHGLDLVNGVGAFVPDRYVQLRRLIAREWGEGGAESLEDTAALRYLKHQFPIGYVVVHESAPARLRAAAARAPSLEPLFAEEGARVYRLHRGGAGRVLRRAFRDDQLGAGRLRARLRAPAPSSVRVAFNDRDLGALELGPAPLDVEWKFGAGERRRGLNTLVLTALTPGATVELLDLGAR